MKKLIIGLTGASGSAYFLDLIDQLCALDLTIHIIASDAGTRVLEYETGVVLADHIKRWNFSAANVLLEDPENLFSKVASGSYRPDAMVVVPCSMSTMAQIAQGISSTLLTRAADVIIKEKKPLIIVPRETPLSGIHLRNMLQLSDVGATILPAMPGFYGHPKTVQDMVHFMTGKILDTLSIDNDLYQRWEGFED